MDRQVVAKAIIHLQESLNYFFSFQIKIIFPLKKIHILSTEKNHELSGFYLTRGNVLQVHSGLLVTVLTGLPGSQLLHCTVSACLSV